MISRAGRAGLLPVFLSASLLAVSACGSGGSTVGAVTGSAPPAGVEAPGAATSTLAPDNADPDNDADPPPADPGPGEPAPTTTAPTRVLPNLVGKGLQVAQDRAQAAGFRRMTSHDASGRDRLQLLDRDWKVCFQSPSRGRRAADTRVDFGAVKLGERCPSRDKGATDSARSTMPDLRGQSAAKAIAALILEASITWRDGTGADRAVVLPTNWKVCAQSPKPGARYDGVPVTLTVVKVRENC
jgi:hypothetical protein